MRKIKNRNRLIIIIMMISAIIGIAYYWISNAPKRALEKQIIAMQDQQINLNFEKSHTFLNGIDTIFEPLPIKKLIVYVDSTSCTDCFMNHMVDYYEINDSIKNYGGSLVVVINPGREMIHSVIYRIKNERFPFWCIVDEECEFIKNNQSIPNNKILQTFMVDSKNRITLVGDPVRNKSIMNLIIRITHENLVI